MPNNRMQHLDTKKRSRYQKRRLRPPRYHKNDISIPKKDAPNENSKEKGIRTVFVMPAFRSNSSSGERRVSLCISV